MNGLGTNYDMRREELLALITIIPKEGKDVTLCSRYRLISQIQNYLQKVLATEMKYLMTDLMHADQVGFIPGREGRGNVVRTLLLLQKIRKGSTPGLLLSIDAEKVFDRVDWGFMMNTLEVMGIGPRMIQWIKVLYNHPTATVGNNGAPPFEMFNGMRQGCHLSPLLFVLSLEPLLGTIQNSPDIRGVKIGDEEHKIVAYALFYISNPRITKPNLMKILKYYGELSHLKVNP